MATTDVQWLVAEQMIALIRANLPGIQVEAGWPGDDVQERCVWLDELRSVSVEIPVFGAGRITRDDVFELPFAVRVALGATLEDTHRALAEIVAGVEDALADTPGLGDDTDTPFDGVLWGEITDKSRMVGVTQTGPIGIAEIVVTVHSRLD